MQPSRNVDRLVEIMRALRDPDGGCPWDLEQSFDTIVPYTIEETYEVVDAIERRDPEDFREELGDLLLQVVYHAQLAEELRLFAFEDVVETITRKMIRRHPHVFGDAVARSARSAKGEWNRIKAEERAEKAEARNRRIAGSSSAGAEAPDVASGWNGPAPAGRSEPMLLLDAVPGAFPALLLALKIQQKAATVGFDWSEPRQIVAKVREELAEFEAAAADGGRDAVEDELGDIFFSLVNLARRYDVDPDTALRRTIRKFRERFAHVETRLREDGRALETASLEEMEILWQEAKTGARP